MAFWAMLGTATKYLMMQEAAKQARKAGASFSPFDVAEAMKKKTPETKTPTGEKFAGDITEIPEGAKKSAFEKSFNEWMKEADKIKEPQEKAGFLKGLGYGIIAKPLETNGWEAYAGKTFGDIIRTGMRLEPGEVITPEERTEAEEERAEEEFNRYLKVRGAGYEPYREPSYEATGRIKKPEFITQFGKKPLFWYPEEKEAKKPTWGQQQKIEAVRADLKRGRGTYLLANRLRDVDINTLKDAIGYISAKGLDPSLYKEELKKYKEGIVPTESVKEFWWR